MDAVGVQGAEHPNGREGKSSVPQRARQKDTKQRGQNCKSHEGMGRLSRKGHRKCPAQEEAAPVERPVRAHPPKKSKTPEMEGGREVGGGGGDALGGNLPTLSCQAASPPPHQYEKVQRKNIQRLKKKNNRILWFYFFILGSKPQCSG